MNIIDELRAHNRWRCGGDGPATDARRLTILIDAACDELERLRGLHGAAPRLESANDLPARLREHAAIHDAATSPYDDEQAQWAQDLRDAADELERLRAASDPGIKMPVGCACSPESWDGYEIAPICNSYIGSIYGEPCKRCKHNNECHRA